MEEQSVEDMLMHKQHVNRMLPKICNLIRNHKMSPSSQKTLVRKKYNSSYTAVDPDRCCSKVASSHYKLMPSLLVKWKTSANSVEPYILKRSQKE